MWSKKQIFTRRVQQSSEHTLKISLPVKWTRLNKLEKHDLVSCNIMRLSDGHAAMIVDKIVTKPTTLEDLEDS